MHILWPALFCLLLSGCGAVELVASGISDGTKFVIQKVEEDQRAAANPPPGTQPALDETTQDGATATAYPAPLREPVPTDAPAVRAAPVAPVTQGAPLD